MGTAEIKDKDGNILYTYYMDSRLQDNLVRKVIPSLSKKDKDCFVVIDGREGAGKSTLAMQLGKFVDPTLDLSRIVFTPDDFREAVYKAKKGQCVIYDEAFTGFSSRSSLGAINRTLVSLSMQMRQKNLFVIIVLPTIYLLDKYIALFRAKVLIHVYESKGIRGYFKLYNYKLKKNLILNGQKTFSYSSKFARTNFRGRFYGKFALGSDEIEEKYRKKKAKALEDSEKSPMTAGQVKFRDQRDLLIYLVRKYSNLQYREMSNMLADYDFDFSFQQIAKICAKFGDKEHPKEIKPIRNTPKSEDIEVKEPEVEEIIPETDELPPEMQENDYTGDDFD